MKALAFQIRLLQPVLAGQPKSGEENSNVSYSFIPGSMLRGALAACYSGGRGGDVGDAAFYDLFFSGKVSFLNAYLWEPETSTRMLPRPLSWLVEKGDVHNLSAPIQDFAVQNASQDKTYKPPDGDYCWLSEDAVKLATPLVEMVVHNASTDRSRKVEGSSQVYRYDALAAGQVFSAVIVSENEEHLNTIRGLLEKHDLVLGGSLTGGYGRVEVLRPLYIDRDWREEKSFRQEDVVPQEGAVYLTCLSDVILRHANGEPDFNLETLAGEPPQQAFRRVRLVGGYSRKWGLPLTQDWAIEAGSVFVFSPACRPRLQAAVESGVGERLVEGFGRIILDLHTRPERVRSAMSDRSLVPSQAPEKLSPNSQKYAEAIVRRQLQSKLNQALTERINALARGTQAFKGLPQPAQLSRARLAARAAWQGGDLSLIQKHFDELSDLSKRTWKKARIQDETLEDWITERVKDPTKETFDVGKIEFAGVPAVMDEKLRAQTVARLIEGVLGQAVKVARMQKEGER